MEDKPGRKTHIVRLVGTNKNGDVLQDMWVDVERIDKLYTRTQSRGTDPLLDPSNQYQELGIYLKWRDDPQNPPYEPETSLDTTSDREYKIIKICDVDIEDKDDPEEWIPVRAIEKMTLINAGKEVVRQFKKSDSESEPNRKVKARRVIHYDTNIDADAQSEFDRDPSLMAYVVSSREYEVDVDSKDADQYIEEEIIDYYERTDSNFLQTNGRDQGTTAKLRNRYILDLTEKTSDTNKPFRLDPFQNIINVQLGGLAVEFGDGTKDAPGDKK